MFSLITAFLCFTGIQIISAQNLPQGISKGASVEGITEYNLSNGLRVLLFPDPSKPTITVNITYLVGSRHEGYGETGMAHLLEHLVFKGTPKHPNIPQELTEQAFYRKYYQPDNAVLTVTGKFDPSKTLEYIHTYFASIPKPDRKLEYTYTKEPAQDGERQVVLRRKGDVQVVSCSYHSAPGSHRDYAAIAIIDEILSNEPAGRLYKALVETKKASYVYSFAPSLKESGFVYINATLRKEDNLEEAQKLLMSVMDSLKYNQPTKEELERSRKRLLKQWELGFNSSERVGLNISEYISQGDWRLYFLFRDALEKVTVYSFLKIRLTE